MIFQEPMASLSPIHTVGNQITEAIKPRTEVLGDEAVLEDEAAAALDVAVRAQILNLIKDWQGEFDSTCRFVSRGLSVIESGCDRVVVVQAGRIVDVAETDELTLVGFSASRELG